MNGLNAASADNARAVKAGNVRASIALQQAMCVHLQSLTRRWVSVCVRDMDGAQYLMVLGVVQRHDLLRDLWFECLCSNQRHSAYLRICRRTLYAYGSGGSEKVGAAAMSITIWSVALAAAGKVKFELGDASGRRRGHRNARGNDGGRQLQWHASPEA